MYSSELPNSDQDTTIKAQCAVNVTSEIYRDQFKECAVMDNTYSWLRYTSNSFV